MKYPSDGSPLVPTDDIPLVVDGSEMPAVDNDALNQLLPASRRDGTGKMFQATLTTARTCLNFLWSRYGRKLNAQKTPRFAAGADLAAWGRHLKRPQIADEGEGQYRDRICTPLETVTPAAIQAPVNQLVAEVTNVRPLFLEPAIDAAFASPLSFAPGSPTWAAFAQPQNRRLWAQDDSRPGEKYGAYASPDANSPYFMFVVPDTADDQLAPHSLPVSTTVDQAQDYANSAALAWQPKTVVGQTLANHAAIALPDGRVLVCGGQTSSAAAAVATASIYDPAADTWTSIPPMTTARSRHALVMLDSGVALAIGGTSSADGSTALGSCEIYDPAANTWTTLPGALNVPRHSFMIVRLRDRRHVVIGGAADLVTALASCEIFDAIGGTWATTGSMSLARTNLARAVVLASGRVLVSGNFTATTACELFTPAAGTWAAAAAMGTARAWHTMALLPSGRALVAGGWDGASAFPTCEFYDEAGNAWTSVNSMPNARYAFRLFRLACGDLVAAGGFSLGTGAVDRFDAASHTWSTQPPMSEAKSTSVGVILPGDEPLVIGGDIGGGSYTQAVERLAPVLTSYGFVPSRPNNLFERIIGEVEPRRATGYPWMLIAEPLLGSDI